MRFEPAAAQSQAPDTAPAALAPEWWLCRHCRHRITREDWLVVRAGNTAHRFRNPAGATFHLRCFARAPGCLNLGDATTHFTWFPGFSWQVALCTACQSHLGWHYCDGDANFWGLITDQLLQSG